MLDFHFKCALDLYLKPKPASEVDIEFRENNEVSLTILKKKLGTLYNCWSTLCIDLIIYKERDKIWIAIYNSSTVVFL